MDSKCEILSTICNVFRKSTRVSSIQMGRIFLIRRSVFTRHGKIMENLFSTTGHGELSDSMLRHRSTYLKRYDCALSTSNAKDVVYYSATFARAPAVLHFRNEVSIAGVLGNRSSLDTKRVVNVVQSRYFKLSILSCRV